MFRAIFELLLSIVVIMAARAILTSVVKGFVKASSTASQQAGSASPANDRQAQPRGTPQSNSANAGVGDLHKDPVCGTYVTEGTAFRRQSAGQTFYYCSESCQKKHALVAR